MPNSLKLADVLPDPTPVDNISSLEQAEETAFNLYRETTILVVVIASSYHGFAEDEFPLDRNQAILSGLLARISKFMKVVIQLAAERANGEVIAALNRCVLETSINMEYLVKSRDPELFNSYVESSLGPEKELYDEIQSNISARGGEHLPIEDRMIASIERSCRASGKTIDQIDKKRGQWGVNLRERMKILDKGDLYLHVQRIGSHAVHGTWVDLKLSHILEDGDTGKYRVRMRKRPDARLLTPTAILVLDSVSGYVDIAFEGVKEAKTVHDTIADLARRLIAFEEIHEVLFQKD